MELKVKENVPLAPLTTFGIGGPARWFVDVRTEDEIRMAIAYAHEHRLRLVVLSGGSNVLIPDGGIDGLVMRLISDNFSFASNELAAEAGCNLLKLIRAASEKNLGGWEKLAGIPGALGGAIRGNAGAFGTEMKDVCVKVRALDSETSEMLEFENAMCDFSYRHSFFKDHPEWIITRAYIRLQPTKFDIAHSLIEETIHEREKRHLQNVKAAGSFFMNPVAPQEVVEMFEQEKNVKSRESRVPAGWLIEKVGMKGATVGDAIASLQHPNYIVNLGSATAHDVRNLAQQIKLEVFDKFGIELHEEAALL